MDICLQIKGLGLSSLSTRNSDYRALPGFILVEKLQRIKTSYKPWEQRYGENRLIFTAGGASSPSRKIPALKCSLQKYQTVSTWFRHIDGMCMSVCVCVCVCVLLIKVKEFQCWHGIHNVTLEK